MALVQGSVFALPFGDASFEGAVSGFVLRNLRDLRSAFAEVARVLRPGAAVAFVDITEPGHPLVRSLFRAYFDRAAPTLGRLVGRGEAYAYLVSSLAQLPPPQEVCRLLEGAGFERCRARPLTSGVATLFTGRRSATPHSGG
jgi:demethylmenaquinone methyltransferase/2-methoxy-6-polyprenyl-1,4-benzoquinol methylase